MAPLSPVGRDLDAAGLPDDAGITSCRSYFVEHTLGKGEVAGSIPAGSTTVQRLRNLPDRGRFVSRGQKLGGCHIPSKELASPS